MESDLILPAQPAYPEPDDFVAEEPYLEAKLYIEQVEQENNLCLEEAHRDRTYEPLATDGPEPLDHGVSITMYPVRVPSMHFSCATVQWDMPQTPVDASSQDTGSSVINLSYGPNVDWTVNPLDIEMIDLVSDKEPGQSDEDLQQGPDISIDIDPCQVCISKALGGHLGNGLRVISNHRSRSRFALRERYV